MCSIFHYSLVIIAVGVVIIKSKSYFLFLLFFCHANNSFIPFHTFRLIAAHNFNYCSIPSSFCVLFAAAVVFHTHHFKSHSPLDFKQCENLQNMRTRWKEEEEEIDKKIIILNFYLTHRNNNNLHCNK